MKNKFINIKDSTPEKEKLVLLKAKYIKNSKNEEMLITGCWDGECFLLGNPKLHWEYDFGLGVVVTEWMPLPENETGKQND